MMMPVNIFVAGVLVLWCLPAQAQTDKFQVDVPAQAVLEVEASRALVRQKKMVPAIERLVSLVETEPDYYRAYYNLGLALAKSGQAETGLQALEKAAQIKEDQHIEDVTLLASIGWTHYLTGNYQSAKEVLEEALQQQGLKESSRIKILNNLGTVHKRLGEFAAAREVLMESAAAGSTRAEANIRIIDATERMQIQVQRSLPFNLVVPEGSKNTGGGESH